MPDILLKKQVYKYILLVLISFSVGVLFDYFVLYKYFNFPNRKQECATSAVVDNISPIVSESAELDKKIKVESVCKLHIDISGALKEPGVFCLNEGSMIIDAVMKAGGFTKDVAYRFVSRKINLSQRLLDNQKIYIPFEQEMECKTLSFLPQTKEVENIVQNSTNISQPTSEVSSSVTTTPEKPSCININSANVSELDTLNGVGETTAKKIVEGRPYSQIEDLLKVSGIGEVLFAKFKEQICI